MITGMAMTKDDQIRIIAEQAGITAAQARAALDAVAAIVTAGLIRDERVSLHGLGTFVVQHRAPRRVMNPHSGVMMDLPSSRVVKFRPAKNVRDRIGGT